MSDWHLCIPGYVYAFGHVTSEDRFINLDVERGRADVPRRRARHGCYARMLGRTSGREAAPRQIQTPIPLPVPRA